MVTKTRGRTRAVTSAVTAKSTVDPALTKQIVETYVANRTSNAAAKDYKAKRSNLLAAMQKAGRGEAQITAKVPNAEGKLVEVSLTAEIETGSSSGIDMAKLLKLVPMDDKLKGILKAGVEDVKKLYGETILSQVKTSKSGETNVSVSPTK